jgi:uncharacterized protein
VIRIVLDTNILVSALLNPRGTPARLFVLTMTEPEVRLCISGDIYAEYEEVVRRPRLKRSEVEIEAALHAVREQGIWVKPGDRVKACTDPDDDIFLECAQAANADYLVTGNAKDFPAVWGEVKIVNARALLDLLTER